MCKNAYEKMSERTGKIMIYCKLQKGDDDFKLCVSQRFCKDKDKYIPNDQKGFCKLYKDWNNSDWSKLYNLDYRARGNRYLWFNSCPIFYNFSWEAIEIKVKFDKEYQTQFLAEKNYLEEHGIPYEFVKTVDGISTYKYKKTVELFKCLYEFYQTVYYK